MENSGGFSADAATVTVFLASFYHISSLKQQSRGGVKVSVQSCLALASFGYRRLLHVTGHRQVRLPARFGSSLNSAKTRGIRAANCLKGNSCVCVCVVVYVVAENAL